MYKSDHFWIEELLPKEFFLKYRHKGDALWLIFDDRLLMTLDSLRDQFGIMTINDWLWSGNRQFSGFRPWDSLGSELSQHKFGRAADVIFRDHEAKDIREWIIKNRNYFPYITGIEKDVSWLHIDVRNYDGLLIFGG